MIQFNAEAKSFTELTETEFKTEGILERADFQEAIVDSWSVFRKEIGLPECFLIGKEIKPHSSVNDSIDLLAFDPNENELVVIELKRDKNKLQLLQAISYAAMVATWDIQKLSNQVQRNNNPDAEELIDRIEASGNVSEKVKIILISEKYDPEVIIASQWLHEHYGVDISAFAVNALKLENRLLLDLEQRYPLRELSEMYEERVKKRAIGKTDVEVSWDDVLPKLKFSFAEKALRLCRNEKEGDPRRRRFTHFRSNIDGFAWIIVGFRTNYLNLYIKGKPEGAETLFQTKISENVEFSEWAEGYSVNIKTEDEFKKVMQWFNITNC